MIYFIQNEDGPIKIGFTNNNPESRLRGLQTSAYQELILIGIMDGGMEAEKYIHALFEEFRIRGEWYTPSESLVKYIDDNTKKYVNSNTKKQKKKHSRYKNLIRLAELAQKEMLDLVDIDIIESEDHLAKIEAKKTQVIYEENLIRKEIEELKAKKQKMLKDRKTQKQLVDFIRSIKN